MYHHVKKLMYTVRVMADPRFGNVPSSSAAPRQIAARCSNRCRINCEDPARRN